MKIAIVWTFAIGLAGLPAAPTERPPIVGIAHIAFYVSNLAKARQFYGELPGYDEAFYRGSLLSNIFARASIRGSMGAPSKE